MAPSKYIIPPELSPLQRPRIQHPYDTSIAQIPNKSSSGQLQDIINISLPPVIPYSSYYHVDRNL